MNIWNLVSVDFKSPHQKKNMNSNMNILSDKKIISMAVFTKLVAYK